MTHILTTPRLDDFFAELVSDAQRSVGADLPEGAATYLVGLLSDFATPNHERDAVFSHSLTLYLHESLSLQAPQDRFVRLRALGDGALYMGGFFAENFKRRGIDDAYVRAIGCSAYTHAGLVLRTGSAPESKPFDLFATLVAVFDRLTAVLARVASKLMGEGLSSASRALRAYEHWLKTDDAELAKVLAGLGIATAPGKA